jgi:hypothetical protein
MTDTAGVYASDPILRAVQIGLEAKHFIEHDPLGKHLVQRAESSRQQALEALSICNPFNAQEVAELQWQSRIPELFLAWLDEAIARGQEAEQEAEALDAEEGYK